MNQHNLVTGEAAVDMVVSQIHNNEPGVQEFPRATLIGATLGGRSHRPRPGRPAASRSQEAKSPARRSRLNPSQSSSMTTESGGSVTVSLPPETVAPEKGAGSTAWGASKVLCDVIDGAVSIAARDAPDIRARNVAGNGAGASGFVFTSEMWILPAASREADALTLGIFTGEPGKVRGLKLNRQRRRILVKRAASRTHGRSA